MKIVHVVRQFIPSVGGLEEVVLNLSRHQLATPGCDVRVVTLDRIFRDRGRRLPANDSVEGIPVTRIPFFGSRRYPLAPAIAACLADSHIVHVHGIDFFFDFLAWTKPLHKKPLLATTHGGFFHTRFATTLKHAYFSSVTRLSATAYERIIACSAPDATLFERIAPGKITTIENGIDLTKMGRCASQTPRPSLIYFGRLSANKRIASVFPVLRHLRARGPDWLLTIAGREDDLTFRDLRAQAEHEGVAGAVRFIDAPSNDALAKLAREATYFISLSAYEGFGITVLEAMSAGLFPILSNIPPFEQFVRRTGTGLIVDPVTPETTARAILALDAQLSGTLAPHQERLRRAAELYDWSRVSDAYLAQYHNALHPRLAASPG